MTYPSSFVIVYASSAQVEESDGKRNGDADWWGHTTIIDGGVCWMYANIMQYMREVTEGREGWGFVEYNRPTIAYICLLDADAKLPII